MAVGVLFTIVTFGFGIICSWPLLLIGFIMIILGIILPSSSTYTQPKSSSSYQYQQGETKRICPNCGKTMPMQSKYCPHCGQKNKYS